MGDLASLNGLHVGMLTEDELALFNAACRAGTAHRDYGGLGGFMGLAKVRLATPTPSDPRLRGDTAPGEVSR
jgi:hypothetical protein